MGTKDQLQKFRNLLIIIQDINSGLLAAFPTTKSQTCLTGHPNSHAHTDMYLHVFVYTTTTTCSLCINWRVLYSCVIEKHFNDFI